MTTNTMTINLDDANLPTTGTAWDAMLKHVMANCDVDDIIEEIKNRESIPLADLLDADCGDDAVVEYVHDAGIPIDAIWDEDELREMEIIQTMLEQEREELDSDGWAKVDEKDEEIEELQKKVAELTEQMRFLDPNGRPCDRCNEPVCYEGNEGKISKKDDAIICAECDAREAQEAKYTTCDSCRRNCYTGGVVVPEGWMCEDCDEDEEASDADTEDDE
jgi:hypothetical protein